MKNTWEHKTLSRGDLSLVVTPGIGGRLMDVQYKGRSLLFTNPDLLGFVPNSKTGELVDFPTRAEHIPFPLWGGEKTWLAPEDNWRDSKPDSVLDSAPYSTSDETLHSLTITSQKNRDGLVIERIISLCDIVDGRFLIKHKVTNAGSQAIDVGLWSVMMLKKAGFLATTVADEGGVSTVFGDPLDSVNQKGRSVIIACHQDNEFKVGCHPNTGNVYAYLPHSDASVGALMTASISVLQEAESYAHGHAFEVYNSAHYPYCELEWHSPLKELQVGNSAEMVTHFTVTACSDEAFFQLVDK